MIERRVTLGLLVISLSAVALYLAEVEARQSCPTTCVPYQQHNVSGTVHYVFDATVAGTAWQSSFTTAATEWNDVFDDADADVFFSNTPHPNASLSVNVSINHSVCPAWGDAKNTNDGHWLILCPATLEQGNAFIQRIIRHEFGHLAGLASNNSCPKAYSVMVDIQPVPWKVQLAVLDVQM